MSNQKEGRLTVPKIIVMLLFLENRNARFTGWEVCRSSNKASGTIYPLLHTMVERRYLDFEWIMPKKHTKESPKKKYFLTEKGRKAFKETISREISKRIVEYL